MSNDNNENVKQINISRKTLYLAIAAIAVVGIGIAAMLGLFSDLTGPEEAAANGEVIATVNGEEVTRAEFEQALEQEKMQYEMQGIDLDSEEMSEMLRELEEHVLENYFVVPILLEQRAREMDITASEEEIEERYQEYATQFGGEEELEEQMAALDLSREELEQDITRELILHNYIDRYLEEYLEDNPDEKIDRDDIELEAEEVENQYQQILDQYNQITEMLEEDDPDMPREQLEMQLSQVEERYGHLLEAESFEDVKEEMEEEMIEERIARQRQEKEQRILMEHIETLLEASEVETDF